MTIFGKILIGLMLATATVLIIKGDGKKQNDEVIVEEIQDETNMDTSENVPDGKFNGSMNDLVARGGDYECSFSHSTDVADSNGTVYISGKKIRGDFNSMTKVAGNIKVDSHMISDEEFTYTWSSMAPTGFKIAVTENEDTTTNTNSQNFDYNQKLDYDCKSWTVDNTKFAVPSDIKFTTI